MFRVHHFEYAPIIIGARMRYRLELPVGATPRLYKTMTTGMRTWNGQVLKTSHGSATALLEPNTSPVDGVVVGPIKTGGPCVIMEHITVDGYFQYMIGDKNILNGNLNFINFGIPGGKHIRIDIYTGESRIIE